MFTRLAAAGLAALTAATLAVAPDSGADASSRSRVCGTDRGRSPEAVGLTADQRLVCFRADKPRLARDIATVSGLQMDTKLVGIDHRPANGVLYGVGDQAGIYTIDPATAVATLAVRADLPLSGTSFGVDFNPAADRLRIVSEAGQNLRINVADGVVTPDGGLTYPPSTAPALGVTGAMYTNNDADPDTVTTLFDVDATLDQVAIQSPPNNGSLVATGKLGVDTTPDVAADIYSEVEDGTTVSNTAYAALSSPQGSSFYSVDLLTGEAGRTGDFSSRNRIVAVAFPQSQR